MTHFNRRIPPRSFETLRELAQSSGDNWWKDLLSLWRPGGNPSGTDGLRLAVRGGSLNFYRFGQSIAKVTCRSNGRCTAEISRKYIGLGDEHSNYVGFGDSSDGSQTIGYGGINDLRAWIKNAERWSQKEKGASEKRFVDDLVSVNSKVLDLEMGLPRWGTRKAPLRMDLVGLERHGATTRIVFWEVKCIGDSRLRCKVPSDETPLRPEVRQQMDDYRAFLSDEARMHAVETSYRETARLLTQFHDWAIKCGASGHLDSCISDIAKPTTVVQVADKARLVIFDDESYSRSAWPKHEQLLREKDVILHTVKKAELLPVSDP